MAVHTQSRCGTRCSFDAMPLDLSDQFGDIDARITRADSLRRCDHPPSPPLFAATADDASPPPALPSTRTAVKKAAAADNCVIAQRWPKRSKRGLVMNGQYASNGFAPRAKRTKKPFRNPPNDSRVQTTIGAKKRKHSKSPQRSSSPPPPPSPVAAPPPSSPTTQPSASRKKRCKTTVGTASKVLTEAALAKKREAERKQL